VDDEEDMVWTLEHNLANDNLPVEVLVARSGEEALEVLRRTPVSLVVTDIKMPGISGLTLLMEISKHHPGTGVIIMTAYPTADFRNFASTSGALHFIEKPFDIDHLRGLVRNALKGGRGFSGTLEGIELTDVIQINSLSRASGVLRIKAGAGEGEVFFRTGAIVHATSGELEGEEAFYRILGFRTGSLDFTRGKESPRQSITKGCEALVLEGMRRLDEAQVKAAAPPPEPEQPDVVQTILGSLANIEGIQYAALVQRDGFIAREERPPTFPGDLDVEIMGALVSKTILAAQKAVGFVAQTPLRMGILEHDQGSIILHPVGKDIFLVVLAGSRTNMGRLMAIVARHLHELSFFAEGI
jgi:CheY-like chemotaxis protein